ncbi:hypothetical protein TKK_0017677 [Trichogramma kaykai]
MNITEVTDTNRFIYNHVKENCDLLWGSKQIFIKINKILLEKKNIERAHKDDEQEFEINERDNSNIIASCFGSLEEHDEDIFTSEEQKSTSVNVVEAQQASTSNKNHEECQQSITTPYQDSDNENFSSDEDLCKELGDDQMDDFQWDIDEFDEEDDSDAEDNFSFERTQSFVKLHDILNDENYNSPIDLPITASKIEILLSILKIWSKYNLPNEALEAMCRMINSFVDSKILPASRYKIDKLLSSEDGMEFHATPIRRLIEDHGEYFYNTIHRRNENFEYQNADIYHGFLYKKFVNSLPYEEQNSYATCTFNSDGSPVFKSSTFSLWPIQISVNEIPPEVRQKQTITWALWFGQQKPTDMNVFMKAFTDSFRELSTNEISCTVNNVTKNVKIYGICCCVDSVACAPMQGLTQFNGHYGCNWCLHPGISIKNKKKPKSSTLKYTLLNEKIEMRSSFNMLKFTEESIKTNKAVMGVKKSTVLSHLPGFDIVKGFVPDSLHCIFLGVCRQFAKYWFDESKTDYYLGPNNIKTIETILKSIKAPNQGHMSFNMHQLLHLAQSVIDWGPLWAHHGYPFENGNGEIARAAKSANGVLLQICRNVNFKQCIVTIQRHMQMYNPERLQFYNTLNEKFTAKSLKVSPQSVCRYFGKPRETSDDWIERLSLNRETAYSYNRMVKNNCLYSTRKNFRSDNSFAQLNDGRFIKIVKFIVDPVNNKEYTLCKKLNTSNDSVNKKILSEAGSEETEAILTTLINSVAVYIEIENEKYLSSVPNMLHY